MRLIDADALRAKWRAAMLHMVRGKDGMHPIALEILIEDLEKFPTIEAEPVRHGRLKYRHVNSHHIPSSCKVICMECGYEKSRLDGEIIRYCQYCGAKMDLKGDGSDVRLENLHR